MANFQVHFGTSTTLAGIYAGGAYLLGDFDWGTALLAGGLTSLGGIIPDLDSDSGIPVRELFGLAGAFCPLLLLPRLLDWNLGPEKTLVLIVSSYLLMRYGGSWLFRRITVHRGMFHSIPAMLIAGMVVFHLYGNRPTHLRHFMAFGMMIGFLSHLVLDEIYAVNLMGFRIKLSQFAGSALKLLSPSWSANLLTYGILLLLGTYYWPEQDTTGSRFSDPPIHQTIRPIPLPLRK